jgi:signal transduction histidine kinase
MRKNGTTFHKHVVMVTARDAQGRFTGHYRTMQDVTARRQAEDQLRAALAREQDMVEELRELAKVKSDFVSTISHELRTPLTSITGYIELLADGDAGTLSPAQRDVLEVLDRNARRLMALIENLLTVSRMESGRLTILAAPLDVVSLMDSVHQAVLPAAVSRGQTLRFDVDDDVGVLVADAAQIDRVLLNLLSNAIKFTPEGGEVAVTVRRSNDEVLFTVDDTGIGIAPEEQEELFSRFFRSSRATELAIQGTGLGLAIVKSIVDAHHGRISVQSTPGSGTEITVVLPANGPGGAEPRDGNDAESDGAGIGGGAEVLAASGRSGTPA